MSFNAFGKIAALFLCVTPVLSGRSDVIVEWNKLAMEAIRNESTSPPLAVRNLAIVHAAIYDAVNSIDRGYQPYLFNPNAPADALPEAAAIGAAYESLRRLYPSQAALFQVGLNKTLGSIPEEQNRDDGFVLGQFVALLTSAWRSSDGSSTTVPYIPLFDPGEWQRTPPTFRPPELPHWPNVIPFAMTNGSQFRPSGPPLLSSTQYLRDFNLTKTLGGLNSTNRTAEQTLVARFWSDFSFTVTPPGHWNQIAQNVVTNRNTSLIQSARLFALLNIAMADAGIISWDAKYAFNYWRPVTAIREADLDGNPDTEQDTEWSPLLTTPPFPEYTSGHSTFSAAAARILGAFCGTDNISFTIGSDTVPGILRSYNSFEGAAEEIGMSRIYGGIHFLSADLDGLKAGREVADYVYQNYLRENYPQLTVALQRAHPIDKLSIGIDGNLGRKCVLETSTNLMHWTPIITNTLPFELEMEMRMQNETRFYRAALLPQRE